MVQRNPFGGHELFSTVDTVQRDSAFGFVAESCNRNDLRHSNERRNVNLHASSGCWESPYGQDLHSDCWGAA